MDDAPRCSESDCSKYSNEKMVSQQRRMRYRTVEKSKKEKRNDSSTETAT